MKAPHYPFSRVQSLESLRHPLGLNPAQLVRLARRASDFYFVAKVEKKVDGTERVLYDTKKPLKSVLQRINANFLRRVQYPDYLTGGLPGKDYSDGAKVHAGSAMVIAEDISKFFPSVTFDVVKDIWHRFFGFSDEVAHVLAMLTTRHGHLEQGAPTSSYLANLVFWDVERKLITTLKRIGVTRYTRYVDDIAISSQRFLSDSKIDWIVRELKAMLETKGLRLNPGKHRVMRSNERIKILKLLGNVKPSLHPAERSRVRAIVHQYCQALLKNEETEQLQHILPGVLGHAYKVKRFHSTEGSLLVEQVYHARDKFWSVTGPK